MMQSWSRCCCKAKACDGTVAVKIKEGNSLGAWVVGSREGSVRTARELLERRGVNSAAAAKGGGGYQRANMNKGG